MTGNRTGSTAKAAHSATYERNVSNWAKITA